MKKVKVSIDDKTYEYQVKKEDIDILLEIIGVFAR
jgi:hypothetical protein